MRKLFSIIAIAGMLLSPLAQAGEEKKEKKVKVIKVIGGPGEEKERGFLGVHRVSLTKELRAHFGAPEDAGVLVAKVVEDSPAFKAGLKVGDVLVEVDGKKVKSTWKVQRIIAKKKTGEKSALKIIRNKCERKLSASIELRKRPQVEVSRFLKWSSPEGSEDLELEFDLEEFNRAMEGFHLDPFDPDMPKNIFKFQKIESGIEERMKKMEEKLKKLEDKLQGRVLERFLKRKTG
jgi:hypothetical protein